MAEQWRSFKCPLCNGLLLVGDHSIKPDREGAEKQRLRAIEAAAKAVFDSFELGESDAVLQEKIVRLKDVLA